MVGVVEVYFSNNEVYECWIMIDEEEHHHKKVIAPLL